MLPIDLAFIFLKEERVNWDDLASNIEGGKEQLTMGRLARPWDRVAAQHGSKSDEETRKYPSLRHLQEFKNEDEEWDADKKGRENLLEDRIQYGEQKNEEDRATDEADRQFYINRQIDRFKNSFEGKQLVIDLENRKEQNRINELTGDPRIPLEPEYLSAPYRVTNFSADNRLLSEALRSGDFGQYEDIQNRKIQAREEFQQNKEQQPVAVEPPVVTPPEKSPYAHWDQEGLGSLFE